MARCLRRLSVTRRPSAAAGVDVVIGLEVAAYTLRAVDAAGAGVAFTVALADFPAQVFNFAAKEAWTERDLRLESELTLRVASAAGGQVELLAWDG